MDSLPILDRLELGHRLRNLRPELARTLAERWRARHQDPSPESGEPVSRAFDEDAGELLDFLAGAVEGGSLAAFEEYARWKSRVLVSRALSTTDLVQDFQDMEAWLGTRLPPIQKEAVTRALRAGVQAASEARTGGPGIPAARSPLQAVQERFLRVILQGDRREATRLSLEALQEGHSIPDLYIEVFQESQYELGRLWESNRITVAEEHMATAVTQSVLARLYPYIEPARPPLGNLVITGVEGEMHQIGGHMVSDLFEARGWDVRFLGTNVPRDGVLQALEEHQADLLGISATMLFSVPNVVELVHAVRQRFGPTRPRILVGGATFRLAPRLAGELGVESCVGDLRQL